MGNHRSGNKKHPSNFSPREQQNLLTRADWFAGLNEKFGPREIGLTNANGERKKERVYNKRQRLNSSGDIHNDSKSHIYFLNFISLSLSDCAGLVCVRERPPRTGISIDLYLFPSGWGGERTNGRGELRTERYWRNGQTSSLSLSRLLFLLLLAGGGSRRVSEFSMAISARMSRRDSEKTTMRVLYGVLLHAISQSTERPIIKYSMAKSEKRNDAIFLLSGSILLGWKAAASEGAQCDRRRLSAAAGAHLSPRCRFNEPLNSQHPPLILAPISYTLVMFAFFFPVNLQSGDMLSFVLKIFKFWQADE
jgi:hypothetical protein